MASLAWQWRLRRILFSPEAARALAEAFASPPRNSSHQAGFWKCVGSAPVKTVIDALAAANAAFQPVQQIANDMGAQAATPTEYPGIAFQLELLVTALTFHLGSSWKPAKQKWEGWKT